MGCSNEMQPVSWGWKMSKAGLTLVQTDLLPAPENILQVIRCGCTSDYKKNVLWLELFEKVWHAKMQVLKVSQMMKDIVNNAH